MDKKYRGQVAENLALKLLQKKDHLLLATNYRCRAGEVDIITLDKKQKEIVFVEVRSRWTRKFPDAGNPLVSTPEDSVSFPKINKIEKTAWSFLEKEPAIWQKYFQKIPLYSFPDWRIDLISVVVETDSQKARLRHYQYLFA